MLAMMILMEGWSTFAGSASTKETAPPGLIELMPSSILICLYFVASQVFVSQTIALLIVQGYPLETATDVSMS
jgi:hypothetical protein